MLKNFKNFILDIFFPKYCLGCKKDGPLLCKNCFLEEQRRKILPTSIKKFPTIPNISFLYYCFQYKDAKIIKKCIHALKYRFNEDLSIILSTFYADSFKELLKMPPALQNFILVPVPISKKRLRFRGFNQSLILSLGLKEILQSKYGIELNLLDCLEKIRHTPPQAELKKEERLVNLKNCMKLKPAYTEQIKNKRILLIDDVATTGATLSECAKTLKNAGALEVSGFVLCKT